MRKVINIIIPLLLLLTYSCKDTSNGQLVGVQNREVWYQPDPYGTLFIPMGSYNMGPSDQDISFAQTSQSKTVSVQAFYMDETEVSNNEYRQFVEWVRDSISRKKLGDDYLITENDYGESLDVPLINWDIELDYNSDDVRELLVDMYLPNNERFYGRKEFDTRKYSFEYYWIDLREASRKENREQGQIDRSVFIKKDITQIYPDTLCWVSDFTYSFNEPMCNMYFWHPAYDDYPVVGVSWKQARSFTIWRTQLLNCYKSNGSETFVQDFRLPTESEWEYASRGGLDLSPYPWGGPYIRNSRGCFLGNFKPLRGNYVDDGGFHTVKVSSYSPNDYGLYCMSGNVAEWTNNAYDESVYNFAHDLNMDYQYESKESDAIGLKRKVIKGGSWKDIGFYLQNGTRTYEFQDTAKSYIGFRCVMTYLGRSIGDM